MPSQTSLVLLFYLTPAPSLSPLSLLLLTTAPSSFLPLPPSASSLPGAGGIQRTAAASGAGEPPPGACAAAAGARPGAGGDGCGPHGRDKSRWAAPRHGLLQIRREAWQRPAGGAPARPAPAGGAARLGRRRPGMATSGGRCGQARWAAAQPGPSAYGFFNFFPKSACEWY